ncbi:MmoB/DmpM family protein [Kyrpidia spormannii]|uniref:Toluene-4-monooxygenase system, effector component n=2 Tax=Kyrpidia spormannii TaxID=2055160 RepID=A0ACA8ZBI5_9BACL|nr:MmoB/DmpM family protein [Kyrpidia spormannii]CAB3393607.1 Toluene-4-monooxygenase system, effector component [Kyrpidia spormannii]CAB3394529.1 Toluene-4-monooxygenase system, effector component [Kyrpidia spormannii]
MTIRQSGAAKVGPVLRASEITEAIVEAIKIDNPDRQVDIQDQGGYVRVMVEGRCVVTKKTIEHVLGREFRMPGELEVYLSSFAGRIRTGSEQVVWEFLNKN